MTQKLRFYILTTIIALVLSACSFPPTSTPQPPKIIDPLPTSTPEPTLELIVGADASAPFNAVGQAINYTYQIRNTGGSVFPGPVGVADDKATTTCLDVNTVGNLDGNLDANETVTCTGAYSITQADLDIGSVTTVATATVGGSVSSPITTNITMTQNKALTLSKTADPVTYNSAGQQIIYSYVITNTGNVTLGPVQFPISDDKIGAPFNCGSDATSLAPNATASCSATYTITQADLNASLVINNASTSDGTITSNNATTTINRLGSELTPSYGTVSHEVKNGEWLWQIARCYGADPRAVVEEFKRKYPLEDPAKIKSGMIVTVPNIGSQGTNYSQDGRSCVTLYTVQSGDTWDSIAARYTVSILLLQQANPGATLLPMSVLKVPNNSAGGSGYLEPAQPIRINFASGATSQTLSGAITYGTDRYVLFASQGQIMNVQVTAPAGQFTLAIYGPNNSTLKPWDSVLTWTGTLPATGDYYFDIASVLGDYAKSYTLFVSVTAP